jgi:hypothetical protein
MDKLLQRLMRTGGRRALSGSQTWTIVAIIAGTLRVVRWMSRPKPDVLWRQKLKPGDRFEVTVGPGRG